MGTIDTTRMRPGRRVEIDGDPHVIIQYDHMKPGKGGAIVRLKLKSLTSGGVIDRTLKSGASLPEAEVEEVRMQFLYADGEARIFMDQDTYDQVSIPASSIENADLLPESCEVQVVKHNGIPIGIELPNFVVLEVAETDPPEKGGKLKAATLSTGAVVQVPSFIDRGEKLKIDTRNRKYVERA